MSNDEDEDLKESRFTKENREKKEMVRFDGMALTKSGKLTKTNFFNFLKLDLDNYSDIELTPDQAMKIHNHLLKMSTGSTAMTPLYCGGSVCPFRDSCTWYEMEKAPVGRRCPVETTLMRQWTMDIIEEFDIDPQNFTELAYANEIVEIMILDRRLNMNIAKVENSQLIMDQDVGVDKEGDPITQKIISPFMELKEKLANRRSKVIKLMVGDRQERYKKEAALKISDNKDASSEQAKMRKKLEDLKRKLTEIETKADDKQSETPKFYGEGVLTPDDIFAQDDKE